MAGPAIRCWEFAKALSKNHQVTLSPVNEPDIQHPSIQLKSHKNYNLSELLKDADVLITQTITPYMALLAKKNRVKIILDAYDPLPLEYLEIFKHSPPKVRNNKTDRVLNFFNLAFTVADHIICANSKQRDLWIGYLMGLKKITPDLYEKDISLNHKVSVVPFGLSSQSPVKTGEGFRRKFKLKESDKLIIWGGGIWNWFDPLTLIKAMKEVCQKRNDIHLVFMGIKHPNDAIPEMEMSKKAIELATELNLANKNVHFNHDWIPYDQRQNYLLEADIGISTHFDHLETQFAFRTRILDYFWAELPIIATKGDSFAELIEKFELGCVVDFQNSGELASSIIALVDNPSKKVKIKENISKIKCHFFWETVVHPIERTLDRYQETNGIGMSVKDYFVIGKSFLSLYGPKAVFKHFYSKILP